MEHSISYHLPIGLAIKDGKCAFSNLYTLCLQQHKCLITFKPLFKTLSVTKGSGDIYQHLETILAFKIYCSQHCVLHCHCQTKISDYLINFLILFNYRQSMFSSRNLSSNMLKSALFSLKNRKIFQRFRSQTTALSLFHDESQVT